MFNIHPLINDLYMWHTLYTKGFKAFETFSNKASNGELSIPLRSNIYPIDMDLCKWSEPRLYLLLDTFKWDHGSEVNSAIGLTQVKAIYVHEVTKMAE